MGKHHDRDSHIPVPVGLWAGVLLLNLGLAACGPGSPSGPGGAGSVAINPNGLTLSVGGEGALTADARDAGGSVLPASAVTWTSLNASVASVDSTGAVSGHAVGTTRVLASAAEAADTVTVLVVDQPCNGIQNVPVWHAFLNMFYFDGGPIPPNGHLATSQAVFVRATLTSLGPPINGVAEWTGELAAGITVRGTMPDTSVILSEESEDLISDPTIVSTVDGGGLPIATPGVAGFRLSVNLASCTFQYFAAPSVHTTMSVTEHAVNTLPGPDEGTRTFDLDISLGLLQGGTTPLGDWQSHPLGPWPSFSDYSSYSIVYPPAGQNAYIPSGVFDQFLFGDPPSSAPRGGASANGRTNVYFSITTDSVPPPPPPN